MDCRRREDRGDNVGLLDELHCYGRSEWEGVAKVADIQRNTGADDGIGRHDGTATYCQPGQIRGVEEVVAGYGTPKVVTEERCDGPRLCRTFG